MNLFRKTWNWTWGLIRRPYPTAESIAADGDPYPGIVLFLAVTAATWIIHGLVSGYYRPSAFLLRQVILALIGLPLANTAIYAAIRVFGGEAGWRRLLAFWAFSYLPTAIFFTGGLLGEVVFLQYYGSYEAIPQAILLFGWFFAALMFLWKLWLLLTGLRVIGNLTIAGVIKAILFLAVLAGVYWWALIALRWQAVPYI